VIVCGFLGFLMIFWRICEFWYIFTFMQSMEKVIRLKLRKHQKTFWLSHVFIFQDQTDEKVVIRSRRTKLVHGETVVIPPELASGGHECTDCMRNNLPPSTWELHACRVCGYEFCPMECCVRVQCELPEVFCLKLDRGKITLSVG